MAILPCTPVETAYYTGTINVPEPHETDYPVISADLLAAIDRDTDQDELSGGMRGQAFIW